MKLSTKAHLAQREKGVYEQLQLGCGPSMYTCQHGLEQRQLSPTSLHCKKCAPFNLIQMLCGILF